MHGAIKNIFLSSPAVASDSEGIESLNTGVIVQFESGEEYVANFLSYNSLENLLVNHRSSAELSNEEHYQLVNVVLVNDNAGGNLHRVIELMLAEGDFQIAFRKL